MFIRTANSKEDWELWDRKCLNSPFVSFISLSSWLAAFERIPFLNKYLVLLEENINQLNIVGGIAGLMVNIFGYSFYIFPSGPYIFDKAEYEKSYLKILFQFLVLKKRKIYLNSDYLLNEINSNFKAYKWKFPGLYPFPGFGLLNIPGTNLEDFISSRKSSTRRDIRASFRKGLEVLEIENKEDLIIIYRQLQQNAKRNNYRIKPFWWYKKMWSIQLDTGVGRFLYAIKDNDIKGAIWVIKCGQMYNYIMGASKRETRDLQVGYRLQAEMIKISIDEGLEFYNISIGGPKGVEKFKDDFGREKVKLTCQYASFL